MSVDINIYRMRIGLLNYYFTKIVCKSFSICNYLLYTLLVCMLLLLLLGGDVHPNPGLPGTLTWNNISVCHANVRSLRNYDKLIDIKTRLVDVIQIITLSETFLSQNTDFNLNIDGYNLFRKRQNWQNWRGCNCLYRWKYNCYMQIWTWIWSYLSNVSRVEIA